MASTIAAITTGTGGVVTTADASGNLSLLSGATTVVAVTSAGASVTGTLAVSGGVTLTTALTASQGGTGLTAAGTVGNVLTSNGTIWASSTPAAGTTIGFGTTGLTPSGATSGVVTVAGTLAVANGGTGVTTSTGTTNLVLSNSPTLVSPALGTPASGVLTNCTGTANSLNAGIGVNQVWARVAKSAGVTYTNSSGKPIAVIIKATGFIDWTVTIGGVPTTLQYVNASFIVPNGFTYIVTGGTIATNCWSELS